MIRTSARSAVICCCTALVASVALGQSFSVDADSVMLTAPGGRIPLHFAYVGAAAPPANFIVAVSSFWGDQGLLGVAILNQDCTVAGGVASSSVSFALPAGRVVTACLVVTGLSAGAKYTGTLLVTGAMPEFKKLAINAAAPPPPTLALDHSAETKQVTRPLTFLVPIGYESPVDSVVLQEKSGKTSANGIAIRLDQGAKSPSGFNSSSNLFFTTRGQAIKDFFSSPTAADANVRTVSPGGQSRFEINVRNLTPGEYTIPLRFAGSNTGADTPQTLLTLTVRVRDSIIAAILWLFVALIVSFIGTKILTAQRRRISMLQQIRTLEKMRTADITFTPAAVWVDAMLHLAEKLSSRFWLTGADLIDARINSTRSMIGLLNQVRELRASLSTHLSPIARRRALQALDLLFYGLDPATADDAKIEAVKTQLAPFNDWVRSETLAKAFWMTIQPAMEELRRQTATWSGLPEDAKACIDKLISSLRNSLQIPPTTSDQVENAYIDYVRLKLLYDHKDDNDVFAKLKDQNDVEECFRIADHQDWLRLKQSSLSIATPKNTGTDRLEAYQPLSFAVTPSDPKSGHSFLFRHNVAFAWKFVLLPEQQRKSQPHAEPIVLEPKAFGPSVVQYFPRCGQIQVSAELTYSGETLKVPVSDGPTIHDTTDFDVFHAFEKTEYVSWGIAASVALATGLSTFYFKSGTFGSFQDYLTLFLWGVGVDQGKNFLQSLQTFSPSNTASASK